jgi:hypothetical protein
VHRIAFLPGWERPFEKKPWPDDPHVLSVQRLAAKNKPPKREPVSFVGPAYPTDVRTRSWRKPYFAVLQRANASEPDKTACTGPAANKAIYQDAASLGVSNPPLNEKHRKSALG